MVHGMNEPESRAGTGRVAPVGAVEGAVPAGATQDELEDLYRQSLQDLEEGERVELLRSSGR